jgi:hypothetical protein
MAETLTNPDRTATVRGDKFTVRDRLIREVLYRVRVSLADSQRFQRSGRVPGHRESSS